tara:strand:- start:224 stop:628 length:405 start_codon:yes stop_codon:yes gene_type:complete
MTLQIGWKYGGSGNDRIRMGRRFPDRVLAWCQQPPNDEWGEEVNALQTNFSKPLPLTIGEDIHPIPSQAILCKRREILMWKRIRSGYYEKDDYTIAYNEEYKEWTLFNKMFEGIYWDRTLKGVKKAFKDLFRGR